MLLLLPWWWRQWAAPNTPSLQHPAGSTSTGSSDRDPPNHDTDTRLHARLEHRRERLHVVADRPNGGRYPGGGGRGILRVRLRACGKAVLDDAQGWLPFLARWCPTSPGLQGQSPHLYQGGHVQRGIEVVAPQNRRHRARELVQASQRRRAGSGCSCSRRRVKGEQEEPYCWIEGAAGLGGKVGWGKSRSGRRGRAENSAGKKMLCSLVWETTNLLIMHKASLSTHKPAPRTPSPTPGARDRPPPPCSQAAATCRPQRLRCACLQQATTISRPTSTTAAPHTCSCRHTLVRHHMLPPGWRTRRVSLLCCVRCMRVGLCSPLSYCRQPRAGRTPHPAAARASAQSQQPPTLLPPPQIHQAPATRGRGSRGAGASCQSWQRALTPTMRCQLPPACRCVVTGGPTVRIHPACLSHPRAPPTPTAHITGDPSAAATRSRGLRGAGQGCGSHGSSSAAGRPHSRSGRRSSRRGGSAAQPAVTGLAAGGADGGAATARGSTCSRCM